MELPQDGYRFTFVFADDSAKPREHGPFTLIGGDELSDRPIYEDITVPVGQRVVKQFDRHVRQSGWFPYWVFTLAPDKEGADSLISALTVHRQAPNLAHAPPKRVSPAAHCTLAVTITMPPTPAGKANKLSAASIGRLKEAFLHYRVDDKESFKSVPLKSEDGFVYAAKLQPDDLKGRWLEYSFSAVDDAGRAVRLPDSASRDVFRTRLSGDDNPPTVIHKPIRHCKAGQPLPIETVVRDPDGIAAVRVHYRLLDESLPYDCVVLDRKGDTFRGHIPGAAIHSDFDLVYFLEAVDEAGNGCFFPDWTKTAPYIIVTTE
jgi:hypothetical protein